MFVHQKDQKVFGAKKKQKIPFFSIDDCRVYFVSKIVSFLHSNTEHLPTICAILQAYRLAIKNFAMPASKVKLIETYLCVA
jgi:hypothetical protein